MFPLKKGDVGTNLARYKAILESNFNNTGVFDLGKPMFVMDFPDHLLDNLCKAGIIDLQSNDGRVDTKLNRRNMQC